MYNPNENRFGDPEDQFTRPPRKNMSTMTAAALACSIIGLVLCETGWFGIMFGALGVLLARLSRGAADKPFRQAGYAMVIGIIAMLISCGIVIYSLHFIMVNYGSIQNYYNMILEQYNSLMGGSSQLL